MELSDRFINEMLRPFSSGLSIYLSGTLEDCLTLDRGNVFNKSLVINTLGDDIEVPVIARKQVESIINANLNDYKIEKALVPLYTNSQDQNRKTFSGIMREFFCNVSYKQRLLKITTNRGEVYYGGYGLILDKDFNPLLMCELKARRTKKEDNSGELFDTVQYYRAACRVSPKVFIEPNKLINKGIIKKLIPLYTTTDVFLSIERRLPVSLDSRKIEVIVEDFSQFFITPVKPIPGKCNNEVLNKCLNDNIEDILYLI